MLEIKNRFKELKLKI